MAETGPMGRNLVLGTACGYDVAQVWVFVESLRRHYSGEAALLVSGDRPKEFYDYLASRRVAAILFDCAAWMIPHVQFSRLVRYGELLRSTPVQYDRVLLSDVSDVVFQSDPFAGAPAGELVCFMEADGMTIGASGPNRTWISQLYGQEMASRVAGFEVSCSGTVMGTHAGVIEYVQKLVAQVRPDQFLALMATRGHDQGVHNVLLHLGGLPNARKVRNGEHVFTVAYVPDREIVVEGGRIGHAQTGKLPAIVHQYNYKPALAQTVAAEYAPNR